MKDLFYIQWHITNLCNLHCKHCYQDDFSKGKDLDGSGLKKVSDNILTAMRDWNKAVCIHLTGGEPLLKSELFPLLDNLDRHPMVDELGIITNGILINQDLIGKLSTFSKLRKMKISLDGSSAEMNDSMRSEGSFAKVIRNIALFKEYGKFEVLLMFTVMKRNLGHLPSLLKLCQDLGVDGFIIERFIPLGRGKEMIDEVLNKEEWKKMTETLLDFFQSEERVHSFLPYQAFQVSLNGGEPELLGAPCVIGNEGLCVMPEGEVYPCRRLPIPIGNLLKVSLKTIWEESKVLTNLRRKENLKGRCGRCDITDCRGCRSLALSLTGDPLSEDPHCWYSNKVE